MSRRTPRPLRRVACPRFVSLVTTPALADSRRIAASSLALALGLGCAPRAQPLRGAPTVARLPVAALPAGRERVTFRWEYADGDINLRGEGVARVAPPDSARLDFFLDNGLGGGYAILIGDSLAVPGESRQVRRILPPPPLLWATLGRLALPAAADTTVRVEGRTLRADVGSNPRWRVTFDSVRLAEISRISEGKEAERVTRTDSTHVTYQVLGYPRRLSMTITNRAPSGAFDAAIWRP